MTEPESNPSDAGQPALVLAPWVRIAAVLAGVVLMVLAGRITVPHLGSPVPMTLQSFAVIVIGGVFGSRLGALTMVGYLLLGTLGLPIFANGESGLTRLIGPTGGYLLAFPLAAAATGAIVRTKGIMRAWLGGLAGMVIIHLGGITQLTVLGSDLQVAFGPGPIPFVMASFGKVGVASVMMPWLRRRLPIST